LKKPRRLNAARTASSHPGKHMTELLAVWPRRRIAPHRGADKRLRMNVPEAKARI
jgi:hypothetical protein